MKKLQQMADRTVDLFERVASDQASRTRDSAARVASSLANNVDPEVIALQLTLNSRKNNPDDPITFTAAKVLVIDEFFKANRTRTAYTKEQSGALIREQRAADSADPEIEPA
ncbi:hypothetical protein [Paraburkholderia adhaesiva]|uniref:hypothetical protein n=1 Tax=Paraburkholderia adhaesiva TaxID=2883244 RepID=UPI001F1F1235|nr:hypothetical protein [Paraburkholderia adhaesiva]